MHRTSLALSAAFAATLSVSAHPQSACGDLTPIDAITARAVSTLGLAGAAARIEQGGAMLRETAVGSVGPNDVVPIASATKWLSAAVVMSLVDDGLLALDDPVARYIPSFGGDKSAITVRQCFTHTSGLPGSSLILSDRTITLAEAADRIAQLPLIAVPGTAFSYGGVSMHVVGRVCEIVDGRPWAALFDARIAQPIGMTATDYDAFGVTANPRIAGGARSSLRDYAKFVDMLRAGGISGTIRVLSAASVAEMFRDQTSGLPVLNTPYPGVPYGIGTWLDRLGAQGEPLLVSGAGAFGFSGWVDLERDATGVLSVVDRYTRIQGYVFELQRACADALTPVGITCVGAGTIACDRAVWANANARPIAGDTGFVLQSFAAPPGSAGVVAVTTGVDALGTAIPGIRIHLPLSPPPAIVFATSGADGRATVSASLTALTPGDRFGAQFVWLGTLGCGGVDTLSASPALDVLVR